MAEKVLVQLIDDIDGSEAQEKIRFGWDGRSLVIDLSSKNADKLRKALQPFVDAARPDEEARRSVGRPMGSGRKRASSGAAAAGVEPGAVRVWAAENNIEVPQRGRIPKPILDSYLAAVGS